MDVRLLPAHVAPRSSGRCPRSDRLTGRAHLRTGAHIDPAVRGDRSMAEVARDRLRVGSLGAAPSTSSHHSSGNRSAIKRHNPVTAQRVDAQWATHGGPQRTRTLAGCFRDRCFPAQVPTRFVGGTPVTSGDLLQEAPPSRRGAEPPAHRLLQCSARRTPLRGRRATAGGRRSPRRRHGLRPPGEHRRYRP